MIVCGPVTPAPVPRKSYEKGYLERRSLLRPIHADGGRGREEGLRCRGVWRKNGAVRARVLLAVAAISVLCVCAPAQNHGYSRAAAPAALTHEPPEARVDINRASVAELIKVPGMTRSWAGRIVRFRPYRTKQDLLDRGVVTSSVYDRIKDYIIAHR